MGLQVSCMSTQLDNDENINAQIVHNPKNTSIPELDPSLYLPVDISMISWFPSKNAHKNISKKFTINYEISTGSTCQIFDGEYKGNQCCIKRISKSDTGKKLFVNEIASLNKLSQCDGIIRLIDYFYDENYFYILTQLLQCDLRQMIQRECIFSENNVKIIIYKLLETLNYMHSRNIGHFDIKPENILFDVNDDYEYNPILCDFGDSVIINNNKIYTNFAGTPCYMSPERLNISGHYGWEIKKSDVFAVGCICYELLTGNVLFTGRNDKDILRKILNNKTKNKLNHLPNNEAKQFIKSLINPNTNKRLSACKAMKHNYLSFARDYLSVSDNTTNCCTC